MTAPKTVRIEDLQSLGIILEMQSADKVMEQNRLALQAEFDKRWSRMVNEFTQEKSDCLERLRKSLTISESINGWELTTEFLESNAIAFLRKPAIVPPANVDEPTKQ